MRALLAWEQGFGTGHVATFNKIATFLAARGVEMVAAWAPLANIDRAHSAISHILPAPLSRAASHGLWNDELVPTDKSVGSYAANLIAMGFDEERTLANNQTAWSSIFELVRPDVVIGDYAPGAAIAARDRLPMLNVGTWYSVPAHRDGYFAPYDGEDFTDAAVQDRLRNTINNVLARRNATPLNGLGELFPDDMSFPKAFPQFDGHAGWRGKATTPEIFARVEPPARRGDDILAYLDPSMLRSEVLVAGLLRLGARRLRLCCIGIQSNIAEELTSRGVIVQQSPHSLQEISRDARLFIHHGGAGAVQLGALAGAPQLAIFLDVEKRSHARALERLGIGRGIDMRRLSVPKLRETSQFLLEDKDVASRASETAAELAKQTPERNIYELIAEAAIAAASG
jgi:hypothetical protein